MQNPDFYTVIGHFALPNAEIIYLFYCTNRNAHGLQVGRAFELTHPFIGLTSTANPLPIFSQQIIISSLHVKLTASGLRLAGSPSC